MCVTWNKSWACHLYTGSLWLRLGVSMSWWVLHWGIHEVRVRHSMSKLLYCGHLNIFIWACMGKCPEHPEFHCSTEAFYHTMNSSPSRIAGSAHYVQHILERWLGHRCWQGWTSQRWWNIIVDEIELRWCSVCKHGCSRIDSGIWPPAEYPVAILGRTYMGNVGLQWPQWNLTPYKAYSGGFN